MFGLAAARNGTHQAQTGQHQGVGFWLWNSRGENEVVHIVRLSTAAVAATVHGNHIERRCGHHTKEAATVSVCNLLSDQLIANVQMQPLARKAQCQVLIGAESVDQRAKVVVGVGSIEYGAVVVHAAINTSGVATADFVNRKPSGGARAEGLLRERAANGCFPSHTVS